MAKRKYHILHGKTKRQRDALMKNPGLRLLHANASGFQDFEQNPSRRRRLKSMKNPAAEQMEMFSGSPEEQMQLFAEVGEAGVGVTPGGRITGAKVKGKKKSKKKVSGEDWSAVDTGFKAAAAAGKAPADVSKAQKKLLANLEKATKAFEKEKLAAQKAKSEASRSRAEKKARDAQEKKRAAEKSLKEFRQHARPKQMADLAAKQAAKQRAEMYSGLGVKPGQPKQKKDIIDRLAEGIGGLADVWGESRARKGPKGGATARTIVGFDALGTLKGLNAEQAAKVGYQLGVMRGIDTCGILKSRERKAIRQKAAFELQNAIASLEERIIGKV